MSIRVDCKTIADESVKADLHHIPCRIEYNGPAKVKKYFECNIRPSDDGSFVCRGFCPNDSLQSSYRGRPLHGEKKKVPSGYKGVVLKESHKVYSEDEERNFSILHTFDEYTHWNLDLPPTENDKIASAVQWLEIANVLHGRAKDKENKKP